MLVHQPVVAQNAGSLFSQLVEMMEIPAGDAENFLNVWVLKWGI